MKILGIGYGLWVFFSISVDIAGLIKPGLLKLAYDFVYWISKMLCLHWTLLTDIFVVLGDLERKGLKAAGKGCCLIGK